jgi:hypothetical protein
MDQPLMKLILHESKKSPRRKPPPGQLTTRPSYRRFVLRFKGEIAHHHAADFMSQTIAEHLLEHLLAFGFAR